MFVFWFSFLDIIIFLGLEQANETTKLLKLPWGWWPLAWLRTPNPFLPNLTQQALSSIHTPPSPPQSRSTYQPCFSPSSRTSIFQANLSPHPPNPFILLRAPSLLTGRFLPHHQPVESRPTSKVGSRG